MESLNNQKQCNSSCNKPNQSMFQKMNKMCKQQKRINQQSQNMCNNPNQRGQGDKSMMERLAAEQSAVRKSVRQLQEELGDRKQIKGRLENMAEEMRRVVEALEQGGMTGETLERQKKIYQRMLDFQLAMERQDYSEVRRAERAEQIIRMGPDPLDGTEVGAFRQLHEAERPLLLNPYLDRPENFYAWRADDTLEEVELVPLPANPDSVDFVQAARNDYGLNRQELRNERFRVYSTFRTFKQVLNDPGVSATTRQLVQDQIVYMNANDAPFAGMIRFFDPLL